MPINCVHDPVTHCLECPAIEAQPGIPAYVVRTAVVGWDTGANSAARLDGDLHVYDFSVTLSGAVVVGLKELRTQQLTPELVEHGLLFQLAGALRYVRVVEFGVTQTSLTAFTAADVFEIRRRGTTVTYHKNNRLLYTSERPSAGPRVVNACLYVSGDTVV